MKFSQILLVLVLSVAAAYATVAFTNKPNGTPAAAKETSYERVIRTGTLRCGYEYWDSGIMKNDQTGELYGAWVDLTNALGEASNLKIEWVTQVGWDDVGAALKTNKIDADCAGMWTSASKAKEISFSIPLAYQGVEAFVRGDDHRFDDNLDAINAGNTTVAVVENDNSDFIAQQDFPKAQKVSLGSLNGTDNDLMMQVMTGKADVTFTAPGLWQLFNKNNEGKLRRLAPGHNLRSFGLAFAVNNDDPRLLNLINAGVQEIQNSGFLDKIIDKWSKDYPDMYIKPLKPFP